MIGLTGIESLEAEMRDRLAAKNAEIERLTKQLVRATDALRRIAAIEPVEGKASKNRGAMIHMQSIALAALPDEKSE